MRISDWSSDVCSSDLGAVSGADSPFDSPFDSGVTGASFFASSIVATSLVSTRSLSRKSIAFAPDLIAHMVRVFLSCSTRDEAPILASKTRPRGTFLGADRVFPRPYAMDDGNPSLAAEYYFLGCPRG